MIISLTLMVFLSQDLTLICTFTKVKYENQVPEAKILNCDTTIASDGVLLMINNGGCFRVLLIIFILVKVPGIETLNTWYRIQKEVLLYHCLYIYCLYNDLNNGQFSRNVLNTSGSWEYRVIRKYDYISAISSLIHLI